jgi:hypothetical protein
MMPRLMTSLLLVVVSTLPAAAQSGSPPDPDRSIGVGAQWAAPNTGRGEAPGVQISWRRWFSPIWGIGTDFRLWQRNSTTAIDSPAQIGPGGIAIPSQHGQETRRISSYGFGVGLVARQSIGRISLLSGAGPGFYIDRSDHDTRINESRNAGRISVRSLGLHMLLEMEVRTTSRLSVFAGLRGEVRDVRDAESSSGYPTAGVRFAF